ncbi:MAG: Nif3-like dinuclear metal center hexameric protein [Planctomycetota bacterium]|jgi:dinuclear metal center YbgI/SA1388 family protein
MKAKEIITFIEKIAPPETILPGDRVGLQIGDPEKDVKTILIALTPTAAVAKEAVTRGADMLITHHPILFEPVDSISPATETGHILLTLAGAGIVAYAAHTNLDGAPDGVTAALFDKLGFELAEPLFHHHTPELKKLVTFVPHEHIDNAAKAMGDAGAGIIGDYSHCSFRLQGTGTYIPLEGADPYEGTIGKLEKAEETRLEVLVPKKILPEVLNALFLAHPYDEVAYDVYPLENTDQRYAMGAVATLDKPKPFKKLLYDVKRLLSLDSVRYAGDLQTAVQRIAICGGSGSNLLPVVLQKKCDAFLTGDLKYHYAIDAVDQGLVLADIGHHESELPIVEHLKAMLQRQFEDTKFMESDVDTNPFGYM